MRPHVHRTHRTGWLRASVLGANDGLLSIASLVLGVAGAQASPSGIIVAGIAGLAAGVFSMGAGEYISVASQADTERADLETERLALENEYDRERQELAGIYVRRGLDPELANRVADQLMKHDALGAHARDDIGISSAQAARPLQAAVASSISFAAGGTVPLLAAVMARGTALLPAVAGVSLAFLLALGAAAARAGGAPMITGALRVFVGGALAMGITYAIGVAVGSVV
ncbi:MAG TPA: VIT family protein [Casimicrobiaceae bacterium]|nr:VIT family protein [Casimicrobiaceae bacterium]